MAEARCKRIKEYKQRDTPLEVITTPRYCNPYSDNLLNKCPYFEEKQSLLNCIFNWS
jgi:hypothetical protein